MSRESINCFVHILDSNRTDPIYIGMFQNRVICFRNILIVERYIALKLI